MVTRGRFLKFVDDDGFVTLISIEHISSISYDNEYILIRDTSMTHVIPCQTDYLEIINNYLPYYTFDE